MGILEGDVLMSLTVLDQLRPIHYQAKTLTTIHTMKHLTIFVGTLGTFDFCSYKLEIPSHPFHPQIYEQLR
jgi:hypothetical protein